MFALSLSKGETMAEKQTFGERLATILFSRFPFIAEMWVKKFEAQRVEGIPWAPLKKRYPDAKSGL